MLPTSTARHRARPAPSTSAEMLGTTVDAVGAALTRARSALARRSAGDRIGALTRFDRALLPSFRG